MSTFLESFFLILVSEMGDKTQLLALVLASRFRKPWTVMAGIFVATVLNHAASAWLGGFAAGFVEPQLLRIALALIFFGFAIWILIPDKEGELKTPAPWGAFLTTTVAFFLAEMGDKTQLATVALGARSSNLVAVTFGTTFGMMVANGLGVFCGDRLTRRIPLRWIRVGAAILFFAFGVMILVSDFVSF